MEKIMKCEIHGDSVFHQEKDGRWRCRKCASEYVTIKRNRLKQKLVDYKGGKCEICGYDKCIDALEFHHKNPKEKEMTISRYGKSLQTLKKEADKCILVCANCHREIHYKEKIYAYKTYIRKKVSSNKKIDKINIEEVKKLIERGFSQKNIAKEIGVSLSTYKRFLLLNKGM